MFWVTRRTCNEIVGCQQKLLDHNLFINLGALTLTLELAKVSKGGFDLNFKMSLLARVRDSWNGLRLEIEIASRSSLRVKCQIICYQSKCKGLDSEGALPALPESIPSKSPSVNVMSEPHHETSGSLFPSIGCRRQIKFC